MQMKKGFFITLEGGEGAGKSTQNKRIIKWISEHGGNVVETREPGGTVISDEVGLSLRHRIGIENILWSTDFPHPATTWPNSREAIERQFADIPVAERDLICSGNSARIYNL